MSMNLDTKYIYAGGAVAIASALFGYEYIDAAKYGLIAAGGYYAFDACTKNKEQSFGSFAAAPSQSDCNCKH